MIKEFYFAQKAFITNEGRLLLIKKSEADPNQANKWEVPGGRMKFGENLEEHIKREVKEEVGIDIKVAEPFYLWQWIIQRKNKEGVDLQMQIVAAASLCYANTTEISFSKHEEDDYISEYAWVLFEEINKYDVIENMKPVIKKFIEINTHRHEINDTE
ncbi:MAG: NUDIX hydrolase [Bacteroidota bacterium]